MFEIGQKVVCIKTHPFGYVKEGEEFTIKDIMKECCHILLDVGIPEENLLRECTCGKHHKTDGRMWLGSFRFAPLSEMEEAAEAVNHLLEEITVKV